MHDSLQRCNEVLECCSQDVRAAYLRMTGTSSINHTKAYPKYNILSYVSQKIKKAMKSVVTSSILLVLSVRIVSSFLIVGTSYNIQRPPWVSTSLSTAADDVESLISPHDELMYALGVNLARQLGDIRPLMENSSELTQVARGLLDTVVGKLSEEEQRALLKARGREINDLITQRAYVSNSTQGYIFY